MTSERAKVGLTREVDRRPLPKVQAAGVAGAVTTLVVFIAGQLGLEVPPEVAAALAALFAFAAGYASG